MKTSVSKPEATELWKLQSDYDVQIPRRDLVLVCLTGVKTMQHAFPLESRLLHLTETMIHVS